MNVDSLIAMIHEETERIWMTEPEEIKRFREGIFESSAGSYGFAFPNMVFVNGDMRALSSWITPNAMMKALRDDSFSLQQCQNLFGWLNIVNIDFLAYCGFTEMARVCHAIINSYDEIHEKSDMERILQAWYVYANRMYFWVHHVFPWAAGAPIRTRTAPDVKELAELAGEPGDIDAFFDEVQDQLLEWKTRR